MVDRFQLQAQLLTINHIRASTLAADLIVFVKYSEIVFSMAELVINESS